MVSSAGLRAHPTLRRALPRQSFSRKTLSAGATWNWLSLGIKFLKQRCRCSYLRGHVLCTEARNRRSSLCLAYFLLLFFKKMYWLHLLLHSADSIDVTETQQCPQEPVSFPSSRQVTFIWRSILIKGSTRPNASAATHPEREKLGLFSKLSEGKEAFFPVCFAYF